MGKLHMYQMCAAWLEFIGDIIKKVFFVDIHTLYVCVYGNKQSLFICLLFLGCGLVGH